MLDGVWQHQMLPLGLDDSSLWYLLLKCLCASWQSAQRNLMLTPTAPRPQAPPSLAPRHKPNSDAT